MVTVRHLLECTYEAFNARDIDRALSTVHPDVDWPNGMEGGRVHGRAAVREYWTRQWCSIDPHVEPVRFAVDEGGQMVVDVRQVIRDRAGSLVSDEMVQHIYRVEDGLVRSMEIRKLPGCTIVRRERPADVSAIRGLHEEAFPTPAEARLVDVLRGSGRLVVSLVAEESREIVGHVALSPVSAGASSEGLGLAPLAVARGRRRRGVGSALVRGGLDAGSRAGFGFVVVLGEPASTTGASASQRRVAWGCWTITVAVPPFRRSSCGPEESRAGPAWSGTARSSHFSALIRRSTCLDRRGSGA